MSKNQSNRIPIPTMMNKRPPPPPRPMCFPPHKKYDRTKYMLVEVPPPPPPGPMNKKQCNCHSSTKCIGTEREFILKLPPFMGKAKVSIDACIAKVIRHLWDNGIETVSCCCGHNGVIDDKPTIILPANSSTEHADIVREIIKQVDDREFELLSWKLTEI